MNMCDYRVDSDVPQWHGYEYFIILFYLSDVRLTVSKLGNIVGSYYFQLIKSAKYYGPLYFEPTKLILK